MTTDFAHTTVLLEEAVRLLAPRSGGVYVDATVGGGGHAQAVLEASAPDGRLVAIDRDEQALAAARARLAPFGERAKLVHGRLGDLRAILDGQAVGPVDGILADLGISSPQVDRPERGFSFQKPGPLDMRMDASFGETCADLLERLDEREISRLLHDLGDEPHARRIARAIKEALAEGAIGSTTDLAAVVASAIPARDRLHRRTDPATKTFQALRIAVNEELEDLDRFLADMPDCLAPGGVVCVIAFHSLEDGRVKNRLRDLARHPGLPADIARDLGVSPEPAFELLTRKPVAASDEELAKNPRARSAKLRAARKSAHGAAGEPSTEGGKSAVSARSGVTPAPHELARSVAPDPTRRR